MVLTQGGKMPGLMREFERLKVRIQRAQQHGPRPKMTSVVFAQLDSAWHIHQTAAFKTVVSAYIELLTWYVTREQEAGSAAPSDLAVLAAETDEVFLRLAIGSMHKTIDVMGVSKIDQYLELVTSIAESGIAMLGGDVVKRCWDVVKAIRDALTVAKIKDRKVRIAHDEVLRLEPRCSLCWRQRCWLKRRQDRSLAAFRISP